jgi:hypothetical protein
VCVICGRCGRVVTMRICFCVALSAPLAADANRTINTIADFILSHSQHREAQSAHREHENEKRAKSIELDKESC